MILPGKLRERLTNALLIAYPSYFELQRLLSFDIEELLDAMTPNIPLGNLAFDIIVLAIARGVVKDLFKAACERNPKNTELRKAYYVLLVHDSLLGAFTHSTYNILIDAVSTELKKLDAKSLKPVHWVDNPEKYAQAVYWLIVKVEDMPDGDIAQLLLAAQKRSSFKDLQTVYQLIAPKPTSDGEIAALQNIVSVVEIAPEGYSNHHPPTRAEESTPRRRRGTITRIHFMHNLGRQRRDRQNRARYPSEAHTDPQQNIDQVADILRDRHPNQYVGEAYSHFRQVLQTMRTLSISDPYGMLHDALVRLQDEADTDEPNRVAKYQACFQLATEDHETAVLESFTDMGLYEQLLGETAQPSSALVFGNAGYGKTAYCRMTARWARDWALVVQIDIDKQLFDEIDGEPNGWLTYIRRRTIATLELALPDNRPRQEALREALQNNPQASAAFSGTKLLSGDLSSTPIEQASENNTNALLRSLELLSKAVCGSAGYDSVYVLVDIKNEWQYGTDQLKQFFQPLLTLMQQASDIGYAIKLFLPARLKDPIAQQIQSLKSFDLSWKPAQLAIMLPKYIANLDGSATTPSFAQLCEKDLPFQPDACLAAAAMDRVTGNYSPRRMMALAWSIINLHLARYPNGKHLINAATIEAVLGTCTEPAQPSG